MKKQDSALSFPNPRLLAAIYFGLLSVVGTILTNAFLGLLGVVDIVPVFQAVLLGMIIASCTGAIFGEQIIYCKKPYKMKTFKIGFLMMVVSLPFFDLGLWYLMSPHYAAMFPSTNLLDMVYSFLMIVVYSYLLFGFLLAIACGLAAMYLRGQIVYDILLTDKGRAPHRKKLDLEHHDEHSIHR